jgi:hypothetical protein
MDVCINSESNQLVHGMIGSFYLLQQLYKVVEIIRAERECTEWNVATV